MQVCTENKAQGVRRETNTAQGKPSAVFVTGFEITRLPRTRQQDTLFSITR